MVFSYWVFYRRSKNLGNSYSIPALNPRCGGVWGKNINDFPSIKELSSPLEQGI